MHFFPEHRLLREVHSMWQGHLCHSIANSPGQILLRLVIYGLVPVSAAGILMSSFANHRQHTESHQEEATLTSPSS